MDFICTNCGTINTSEGSPEILACTKCHTIINSVEYERLIDYAGRAVHYGFDYRLEYERQVAEEGEVNVMYSLLQPINYMEWLAVSALGGIVGSYATDLVKYVANQIKDLLTKKSSRDKLSNHEAEVINMISDEKQLNQFIIYIQNYYQGLPNVDKRVIDAITEEQMADVASTDMVEKFAKSMQGSDIEELKKVMFEIAKTTNKKNSVKPDIEQTKRLLRELKKELKEDKERKKKKKK